MPPIIPIPNDIPENGPENSSSEVDAGLNVNIMSDSDSPSDDENVGHEGYEPLSQDPDCFIDNQYDIEEDGNFLAEEMSGEMEISMINHQSLLIQNSVTDEKATGRLVPEDIKMDEEHIETIKSVMKNITLPTSNLPQWAKIVPEEEWKTALFSEMVVKKCEKSSNRKQMLDVSSNNCSLDFQTEVPR
ncbi:male-enhanced antigen 1 [Parasteatoda tepidariorum]|uniref:male-enhanced antigen 1 n=1 Tax=Parasteatoda tepidariorum TaxID=114398 RepID=UPI00077FB04D|nr:male-enhanced antigen 1 [Parasteatoda tepidariorum]